MRTIAFIIAILSLTAGCSRVEPAAETPAGASVGTTGRVIVQRLGTFMDDLAYNRYRGVYLVKDTQTGQEYIGVSGIGISEIGRHATGNNMRTSDER